MATDSEGVWKSTLKAIPNTVDKAAGIQALADWVEARVVSKLALDPSLIVGATPSYVWLQSAFKPPLLTLEPVTDPSTVTAIADAWRDAALTSLMPVLPGISVGSPSPATTFSVVVSLLDPASVASAYNTLSSALLELKPTADPDDVKIGPLLRAAFLSLTFTLTGLNTIVPVPTPLVAAAVPVV